MLATRERSDFPASLCLGMFFGRRKKQLRLRTRLGSQSPRFGSSTEHEPRSWHPLCRRVLSRLLVSSCQASSGLSLSSNPRVRSFQKSIVSPSRSESERRSVHRWEDLSSRDERSHSFTHLTQSHLFFTDSVKLLPRHARQTATLTSSDIDYTHPSLSQSLEKRWSGCTITHLMLCFSRDTTTFSVSMHQHSSNSCRTTPRLTCPPNHRTDHFLLRQGQQLTVLQLEDQSVPDVGITA